MKSKIKDECSGVSALTGKYTCGICGRPIWSGEMVWFESGVDGHVYELCDDCHSLEAAFPHDVVRQMTRFKKGCQT